MVSWCAVSFQSGELVMPWVGTELPIAKKPGVDAFVLPRLCEARRIIRSKAPGPAPRKRWVVVFLYQVVA